VDNGTPDPTDTVKGMTWPPVVMPSASLVRGEALLTECTPCMRNLTIKMWSLGVHTALHGKRSMAEECAESPRPYSIHTSIHAQFT
jgi:hypothetical protein